MTHRVMESYGSVTDPSTWTVASVSVEPLGAHREPASLQRLLGTSGTGWYTTPTALARWSGTVPSDLLDAEVCTDAHTTYVIRRDGGDWHVWRWREGTGETARVVEERFACTERATTGATDAGCLIYRTYWAQRATRFQGSEPLRVWTPLGARFWGFGERA